MAATRSEPNFSLLLGRAHPNRKDSPCQGVQAWRQADPQKLRADPIGSRSSAHPQTPRDSIIQACHRAVVAPNAVPGRFPVRATLAFPDEPRVGDDTKIPVYVTDNGFATHDDGRRIEYIPRSLMGVENRLNDGIDVPGDTYSHFFDNF